MNRANNELISAPRIHIGETLVRFKHPLEFMTYAPCDTFEDRAHVIPDLLSNRGVQYNGEDTGEVFANPFKFHQSELYQPIL